jgi:plastocyanin
MQLSSLGRFSPSVGVAVLAAALAAASLHGEGVHADDATVRIDNFTFAPERLTLKAGTTVAWRNEDDIPHTVISATRLFKSSALDTDDTYSFTFTEPGMYEYFCSLPGTIVVEPGTAR